MIESCLIDTNILVRHLVGKPSEQAEWCTRLLHWADTGGISGVVPPTVVFEVVFTLERQYAATREQVAEAINVLLDFPGLQIEHRHLIREAISIYRSHSGVSYADAYHCALATADHGGVIVSFDRAIGRVPGVDRLEPSDFASSIN